MTLFLTRFSVWSLSLFILILTGCTAPKETLSSPAFTQERTSTTQAEESTTTAIAPNTTQKQDQVESASPSATSGDIWTQLQNPDTAYFVLMRHALAPGTGDPTSFKLDDCATQRNLSEGGRSQARRTGEAFRQQGVTVARVLSSEWCRCLETSRLMDLGPIEPYPPINSFFRDHSTEAEQTEQVQQFMQANADEPSVTILVTHFVNIAALSGSGLESGEMLVMQMDSDDQLTVVGEISPF